MMEVGGWRLEVRVHHNANRNEDQPLEACEADMEIGSVAG